MWFGRTAQFSVSVEGGSEEQAIVINKPVNVSLGCEVSKKEKSQTVLWQTVRINAESSYSVLKTYSVVKTITV